MTAKAAFSPADVYEATGVPVSKQCQWYDRRTIYPSRADKKPSSSGDHRLVCAATVYQFGIVATATRLGIPARVATNAAKLFGVEQPGRAANELYEHGRTLLVIKPGGMEIINAGFIDSLADILGRPFEAAIVIEIGCIVMSVNESLSKISERNK